MLKRSIFLLSLFGILNVFSESWVNCTYQLDGDHVNITCNLYGNEDETNIVIFTAYNYSTQKDLKIQNIVCPPQTNMPHNSWSMSPGTTNYIWNFTKDGISTNDIQQEIVKFTGVSLDSITINFKTDSGESQPSKYIYNIGSKMRQLPYITNSICKFKGWYTQKLTGIQITTNTIATKTYDTLYARLYIDMTFDPRYDDGTTWTNEYQVGSYYSVLKIPNKPGWEFMGWYTQLTNGYKVSEGDTITAVTSTLYAHYADYLIVDISKSYRASIFPYYFTNEIPIVSISEDGSTTNRDWTDEFKTSKIVLRKIEPGTYTFGDKIHRPKHIHPVTLNSQFYMGIFEITQKQWQLICTNKPSYFNNKNYYATRPVENVSMQLIREQPGTNEWRMGIWPNYNPYSQSFLGILTSKTKLSAESITTPFKFDLPTESEWEYCCRAGTTTDFNNGENSDGNEEDDNMDELGRYYYNSKIAYQKCSTKYGTAKVGSYLPNNWGLYDMHGNAFEWCLDYYEPDSTNTTTLVNPTGPNTGTNRVIRGGSWKYKAYDCTSCVRYYLNPTNKTNSTGFRIKATIN